LGRRTDSEPVSIWRGRGGDRGSAVVPESDLVDGSKEASEVLIEALSLSLSLSLCVLS
jgi:hypothetical protein